MQIARTGTLAEVRVTEPAPSGTSLPRRRPYSYPLALESASLAVAAACFVADLILPRGATPAIGYCAIPLLSAGTGRRGFILTLAFICAFLTWVGYALEPPGAPPWMSIFERAMVTGVLGLTQALCWQRTRTLRVLSDQTRQLDQTTRELARSNAELETFASVVAHDLRSPLSATGMFASLLAKRYCGKLDAEFDEWVASIQSDVDRMGVLIQNVLAYAHAGNGRLRAEPCDAQGILAKVLHDLRPEMQASGGVVTHDPLPMLSGDSTQLAELLQNLIQNAIKYRGPCPPRIHIGVREEADAWVFAVRDNGMGIHPEEQARIFRPFERGGDARRAPGSGMGLAICKRIVERHGGRIWVQSVPGDGATFYFTFPRPFAASPERDRISG